MAVTSALHGEFLFFANKGSVNRVFANTVPPISTWESPSSATDALSQRIGDPISYFKSPPRLGVPKPAKVALEWLK